MHDVVRRKEFCMFNWCLSNLQSYPLCCPHVVRFRGVRIGSRDPLLVQEPSCSGWRVSTSFFQQSPQQYVLSAVLGMDLSSVWNASVSSLGPLSPPSHQAGSHGAMWKLAVEGLTSPAELCVTQTIHDNFCA